MLGKEGLSPFAHSRGQWAVGAWGGLSFAAGGEKRRERGGRLALNCLILKRPKQGRWIFLAVPPRQKEERLSARGEREDTPAPQPKPRERPDRILFARLDECRFYGGAGDRIGRFCAVGQNHRLFWAVCPARKGLSKIFPLPRLPLQKKPRFGPPGWRAVPARFVGWSWRSHAPKNFLFFGGRGEKSQARKRLPPLIAGL